jgi:hypothetical protein
MRQETCPSCENWAKGEDFCTCAITIEPFMDWKCKCQEFKPTKEPAFPLTVKNDDKNQAWMKACCEKTSNGKCEYHHDCSSACFSPKIEPDKCITRAPMTELDQAKFESNKHEILAIEGWNKYHDAMDKWKVVRENFIDPEDFGCLGIRELDALLNPSEMNQKENRCTCKTDLDPLTPSPACPVHGIRNQYWLEIHDELTNKTNLVNEQLKNIKQLINNAENKQYSAGYADSCILDDLISALKKLIG